MKKMALVGLMIISAATVLASGRDRDYKTYVHSHSGDTLNWGIGLTSLFSGGTHASMDFRLMHKTVGLKLSLGAELERIVGFQTYSLAWDAMVEVVPNWHLLGGYRWAAVYSSATPYPYQNMPLTYFGGWTAGASGDVWRPNWLPNDRMTVTGSYWFSKTNSAWQIPPAAPKLVFTLTYFFI